MMLRFCTYVIKDTLLGIVTLVFFVLSHSRSHNLTQFTCMLVPYGPPIDQLAVVSSDPLWVLAISPFALYYKTILLKQPFSMLSCHYCEVSWPLSQLRTEYVM